MLTKTIRAFSAAMAILLIATMAAACSGNGNQNESGGDGASNAPATANTGNGGTAAPEENAKISDKKRTVKVLIKDSPNQPLKNGTVVQKEILNRTNIDVQLEAVPNSNYDDKKKTLLATNNLPDITIINQQDVTDYSSTGIFLPLMDYMKEGMLPNFKKHWDALPELKKLTVDGELYAFPAIARNEAKNGSGPVIRMDLLEANNLEVPKTFDELLTVLKKLKEIYPDSHPWTIRKGTQQLLSTTAYSLGTGNGIYFDKDVDGGRYVFGPATEAFKNMLGYFNEAYKSGVLDPDYAVMTSQLWKEKLTSGKSFFFFDNSGFAMDDTRALRKTEPDAKFQIIPVPEYDSGKARATYFATKFSTDTQFAINSQAKDPETLLKFIDWMYSEEASNLTNFGIEGENYELDDQGQPVFKKEFVDPFKDGQPTPYYAVYTELGTGKLNFTPWFANTMTWFQIDKLTGTWDDLNEEYWSIINADDSYVDPTMDPPLTQEESARVKELLLPLNTMLEQEYDKFIMGAKPIGEYDKVIEKARGMGADELEQIYNGALERLASM
ncbi:extracellular solute-binding protein [Paenibacillus sp. HB172176]|uniref:extracellular solute-binding protein n=1 Tax=Paenibacillus sp. HB172176 TaxID=2493690 RepID=UPI00143BCD41|nr:extracellular solute-binding protein [Paenibacillus sp. HB172176]